MLEDTIGVDISKDNLDVHRLSDGAVARFGNDTAGFAALWRWLGQGLGAPGALRVVYEPTGACHGAFERRFAGRLALCRVNPLMARRFAQSTGTRAKTDAVDARLLAVMGAALALEPDPPLSQDMRDLKELQVERLALVRDRTRLLTRLKTLTLRFALSQARARLSLIEGQLKDMTAMITTLITQQRATARAHAILCSIPGLGPVSAAAILIEMPELGTLQSKRCASLAGLAPMTQASGRWRGPGTSSGRTQTPARCPLHARPGRQPPQRPPQAAIPEPEGARKTRQSRARRNHANPARDRKRSGQEGQALDTIPRLTKTDTSRPPVGRRPLSSRAEPVLRNRSAMSGADAGRVVLSRSGPVVVQPNLIPL
jgi:transposase